MQCLLFVCSENRLRSPTAETIFCEIDGIDAIGAGTDDDAPTPVSDDLVQWADVVFVMEASHRNEVSKRFRELLRDERLVVLGIPDDYEYMQEELVRLLKARVGRHVRLGAPGPSGGDRADRPGSRGSTRVRTRSVMPCHPYTRVDRRPPAWTADAHVVSCRDPMGEDRPMARRRLQDLPPADLRETLDALTVDAIKGLLGAVQGRKRGTGRKSELVDELCRALRGDALRATWGKLDDVERAALAEAVHDPAGVFRADRFEAKHGTPPARSRGGSSRSFGRGEPTLFAAFLPGGRLPPDLRAEMLAFVPEPEKARLKVRESLPAALPEGGHADAGPDEDMLPLEVRETELAARLDLRAVLGLLGTGKLSVGETTRLPGEATCRAVGDVLHGGDFLDDESLAAAGEEPVGPMRAFAWPLLLQAAGLAGTHGKRLEPGAAARRAASDAPGETLRLLWRRWCRSTLFDEMRRTDAIKGQTGKGKRGFTALRERREAMQAALAQCPPGQWVAVDELFRFMRASGGGFEVTRDLWSLYLTDSNYGNLGHAGYHDWILLQGRYALCTLFEYVATLGMIDVAYTVPHGARADFRDLWGTDDLEFLSRYDGLRYLRLTPLGAYCLGLSERYEPAEPERRALLEIDPDGAIRSVPPGIDAAERSLLEAFAPPVGRDGWRVSVESLLSAIEAGGEVDELRAFLRARVDGVVPEPVERTLSSAVERAALLQDVGGARVIECGDAELVALIANDPKCAKCCRAFGERHLVVRETDEARFRTAVRALGYGVRRR